MPIYSSKPQDKQAFTIIELLVVISIITLLLAILLPALQKAREAATAISCLSNMRQMSICMNMYLNDYRETFPPRKVSVSSPTNGRYYWVDLLKPYVNEQVPVPGSSPNAWFQDVSPVPRTFTCPKLSLKEAYSTAYNGIGYNNYGLAQDVWATNWKRLNSIQRPSNVLTMADALFKLSGKVYGFSSLNVGDRVAYRHPGRSANAFFVDGHGRTVHLQELGTTWATFYKKYPWMDP